MLPPSLPDGRLIICFRLFENPIFAKRAANGISMDQRISVKRGVMQDKEEKVDIVFNGFVSCKDFLLIFL